MGVTAMAARDNAAPIIIKRKKVVAGDGHHGGAWKVAYADFVTAMMAFFMLMWLLNATTEKQRKGLADYFNPSIPIARTSGGGEGAFGGDNVFSEEAVAQSGTGASAQSPTEERQARGRISDEDAEKTQSEHDFKQMAASIEQALNGAAGELTDQVNLRRHIDVRLTDEGLVIEFFDLPGAALFEPDSATPGQVLRDLSGIVTRVFALVTNPVAIETHTRSYPEVLRKNPSWGLTTQRSQAVRGLLAEAGFSPARVERVTGYADRRPHDLNPMAERNNRIELILLRQ